MDIELDNLKNDSLINKHCFITISLLLVDLFSTVIF